MSVLIYPESPPNAGAIDVSPNSQFRREVARVIIAIVCFVLLYTLLLIAALTLSAVLGYLGLMLIFYLHNFWTIMVGAGLLGIGLMVSFFLVKFVFSNKKQDSNNRVEITRKEYPLLFEFVEKVSKETSTDFPKHIYLTADVNAFVSYDSNIKSLLFPVRKNLTIGLGLVNMVNLSEFKAVLAHEFGHFSQKSMRAGSYVYQVNQVIYNLLYENNGYDETLNKWANVHSVFALCANATAGIIKSIQWILQQAYKEINRIYMGLSRQMEFHADAIAASVAGSNNMTHALRVSEFADFAYNYTLDKYDEWLPNNVKGLNLFEHHKIAACFLAELNKLPVVNGYPYFVNMNEVAISYKRVNVEDQWASHPSREQREAALNEIDANAEISTENAWALFGNNAVKLQEDITSLLYANATFNGPVQELNAHAFAGKLEELKRDNYPELFKNYYDNRIINVADMGNIIPAELQDVEQFFEENSNNYKKLLALVADIHLLEQVSDKNSGVKYFDIDGEKMHIDRATDVIATLKNEQHILQKIIETNDALVYAHYSKVDIDNSTGYRKLYSEFSELVLSTDKGIATGEKVLEKLNATYNESRTLDAANKLCEEIQTEMKQLGDNIKTIEEKIQSLTIITGEVIPEATVKIKENAYVFFQNNNYENEAINNAWNDIVTTLRWYYNLQLTAQKALVAHQFKMIVPTHS
ncbi:MAG TPA: M48 family metalloprotease [Flavipsychrobacter sp.]